MTRNNRRIFLINSCQIHLHPILQQIEIPKLFNLPMAINSIGTPPPPILFGKSWRLHYLFPSFLDYSNFEVPLVRRSTADARMLLPKDKKASEILPKCGLNWRIREIRIVWRTIFFSFSKYWRERATRRRRIPKREGTTEGEHFWWVRIRTNSRHKARTPTGTASSCTMWTTTGFWEKTRPDARSPESFDKLK